tara:strand:- start:117 stop:341 length:225 start_codon:yes stop_codon:yes gene_type:complete
MARPKKERSLGEMISTVSFYGVGVYFVLEGAVVRDEGGAVFSYLGMWFSGALCLMAGARFLIASLIEKMRGGWR